MLLIFILEFLAAVYPAKC